MSLVAEDSQLIAGIRLRLIRGGSGLPLLVLHDELGYPGWMNWNEKLALDRELWIPLQPGFGSTERVDWVRDVRDLGAFYSRWVRESFGGPIDVLGFSFGGWIAAEMAAADSSVFNRMALVAPLGVKPNEGEIFDFLAATIRTHVIATVASDRAPEFGKIYGGEMTPKQFELFEEARAETARLGWEPFMFDPSLPYRLEGLVDLPTLLIWGDADFIVPRDCIIQYSRAINDSQIVEISGVGHRPEIEDPAAFLSTVGAFFSV